MIVPTTSASWSLWGSIEPDTPYDVSSFMWPNPPGLAKNKIYFAAISTYDSTVNPNVAFTDLAVAVSTQIETPSTERHFAILGVWTDCNGDGYIGMAEGALREYRNDLLLNKDLCPHSTGSVQGWNGQNNYNNWVTELIPIAGSIGLDESSYSRDKRIWLDKQAMVWGDYGRPDERPWFRSCALSPQPRGTYTSTGGMINYVDCRVDVVGISNVLIDEAGNPGNLRFSDDDDARTGPLGQVQTFGSEDTQYNPVKLQDCTQPIFRTGTFFNQSGLGGPTGDAGAGGGGTLHDLSVHGVPANPVGNTQNPTLPAFFNATNEAVFGNCDTSDDRGADFYGANQGDFPASRCAVLCVGETDFNGVDPNRKTEADWNFAFDISNRGGFPASLVPGSGGSAGANEGDLGVHMGGSMWLGDSRYLSKPGPQTVRTSVDPLNVEIAPGWWLSFYAHVGTATNQRNFLKPGGIGTYGFTQCGSHTSGIHNGWNCARSDWYVNPDGSRISENAAPFARPGDQYEFRDVDCYDGRVNVGDANVGTQPAYYGNNPCS